MLKGCCLLTALLNIGPATKRLYVLSCGQNTFSDFFRFSDETEAIETVSRTPESVSDFISGRPEQGRESEFGARLSGGFSWECGDQGYFRARPAPTQESVSDRAGPRGGG